MIWIRPLDEASIPEEDDRMPLWDEEEEEGEEEGEVEDKGEVVVAIVE